MVLGVYWGVVPIHLMRGSRSPGVEIGFTFEFIKDIFFHASLPILTYVLATIGGWILSMKSSTMSTSTAYTLWPVGSSRAGAAGPPDGSVTQRPGCGPPQPRNVWHVRAGSVFIYVASFRCFGRS